MAYLPFVSLFSPVRFAPFSFRPFFPPLSFVLTRSPLSSLCFPQGTNKKILTNVLQQGDRFFRTGDLIRQDEHGFFFFVDRIGDTYRTANGPLSPPLSRHEADMYARRRRLEGRERVDERGGRGPLRLPGHPGGQRLRR